MLSQELHKSTTNFVIFIKTTMQQHLKRGALLIGIALLSLHLGFAQTSRTIQTFQTVPQSLNFNLGKLPNYELFIGGPYISNVAGSLRSTGTTLNNLGIAAGKGFFESDFSSIVNKVDEMNKMDLGLKMDLLYLGIRSGNFMFHMHIGEQINFNGVIPRSFYQMMNDIQQGGDQLYSNPYDLSALSVNGLHYRYLGAGFTAALNEYVSIGARAKYLKGLKLVDSNNRGLGFSAQPNSTNFRVNGALDILSSGLDYLADLDNRNIFDYFKGSSIGSHGMAFDLGVNIHVNKDLEIYGTILDIGKINWTQNIDKYTVNNNAKNKFSNESTEAFKEDLDILTDELYLGESDFDTSFSSKIPMQMFGGIAYQINQDISVKAITNIRSYRGEKEIYNTIAASAVLNNYLEVASNITFGKGGLNFGAGFVLNGGPMQFYVASDNLTSLLSVGEAKYLQGTAGINIVFGRPKRKIKKKKHHPNPTRKLVEKEDDEQERRNLANKDNEEDNLKRENSSQEKESDQPKPVVVSENITTEAKDKPALISATNPSETVPPPAEEIKTTTIPVEDIPEATEAVVEEEEAPVELERLVTLEGKTVDNATNEHLTGVTVEFYKVKPDNKLEVMLLTAFYNGNILLHPDRNFPHMIYIRKQGYKPYEYKLTPEEMSGKVSLNLRFALTKER